MGLFPNPSLMAGKTSIANPLLLMTGLTGLHTHYLRGVTGNPFIPIGRIFPGLATDGFMAS